MTLHSSTGEPYQPPPPPPPPPPPEKPPPPLPLELPGAVLEEAIALPSELLKLLAKEPMPAAFHALPTYHVG